MNPLLIAVSGIDGSGKSTLVDMVRRRLEAQGLKATAFRGLDHDSAFLSGVRKLALRDSGADRFMATYLSWSLAVNTEAAWASGADVLLADRYLLDHWANQATFGHTYEELAWVRGLLPEPGLHVFLAIDPETAWQRIVERDSGNPGWQTAGFLQEVSRTFEANLGRLAPQRLLRLPADSASDRLTDATVSRILSLLERA
ncbi:hypothetical protein [Streptomyces sp. VNUA24]|uniref:dTMP kinase n=1 Tax=Streptomyces sp. VNUA24 TaxID=3031131 RepID=UPI0023B79D7C|nr:hypothetical protein [Streptomyces sp. VNUA24]WEH12244.1 hypothetical protein PYR72_00390 [Streptomyces sp. VNUA24]